MSDKITHIKENDAWNASATGKIALNNDGLGYVESYDFSQANTSNDARIYFISKIASVCYANPKALGSISLFNRLATENKGLPSSSYEFIPVLITISYDFGTGVLNDAYSNCIKYGEVLSHIEHPDNVESTDSYVYVLSNLRALIADVGELAQDDKYYNIDQNEIDIIKDNFKVYKSHIDLSTRAQFIRHRVNWQELSRRYVSGKKNAFSFYVSEKMKDVVSYHYINEADKEIDEKNNSNELADYTFGTQELLDMAVTHYNAAIDNGVKPEEARRIIPQAMYTTVWTAMQPLQSEVFYKLRIDSHAQSEIRELAESMKKLDKGI